MFINKHRAIAVAFAITSLMALGSPAQAQLFGKHGLIGGSVGQILHEGIEKPAGQVAGVVHDSSASSPSSDPVSPCPPTGNKACLTNASLK